MNRFAISCGNYFSASLQGKPAPSPPSIEAGLARAQPPRVWNPARETTVTESAGGGNKRFSGSAQRKGKRQTQGVVASSRTHPGSRWVTVQTRGEDIGTGGVSAMVQRGSDQYKDWEEPLKTATEGFFVFDRNL
jgi:hypothetical protein